MRCVASSISSCLAKPSLPAPVPLPIPFPVLAVDSFRPAADLARLFFSAQKTDEQVQNQREDDGVVSKRENRVPEHRSPDLPAYHRHVGNLEAHPDGERKIGKVEIVGFVLAGKNEPA